jgi:flagellar FliL protein
MSAAPQEKPAAEGEEQAPKKGGKMKLIIIAVPVLLLGVGAGLWFTGILPGLLGMKKDEPEQQKVAKPVPPSFIDLPELVANLNSNPARPAYVKIVARLEIRHPDDVDKVRAVMPRLQDMMQTYLREMRPDELRGSAGTYRLREELIARANTAAAPARVADVLFSQLLIQ